MKATISLLIVLVILVVGYSAYMKSLNSQVCIQVITEAKNVITGQVKTFPTPCQVPFWYKPQSSTSTDFAV
jgi:hypothetical protein